MLRQNFTSFVKYTIGNNETVNINMSIANINQFSILYIHCLEEQSFKTLQDIDSLYRAFRVVERPLEENELIKVATVKTKPPVDISMVVTYRYGTKFKSRKFILTQNVTNNILNSLSFLTLVDIANQTFSSLSLEDISSVTSKLTITTRTLNKFNSSKLSLFIKYDNIFVEVED